MFDSLRRKKRYGIEKGMVWKNNPENKSQKLVLDPFLILVNKPKQPLHIRNYFKNRIFWRRIIKWPLKKLTLFFLLNPVPFIGQSYQKQKEPGTSYQLILRLWNKFRKIPLLVMYYLNKFDEIIWSDFLVIPKIASANLCKPIHDIINYASSICPFEPGKCGKEEKKYNVNISRTKRAF